MKSANLLKALSDELRLKILYIIKDRERCVCELMAAFDMPQSSLSHHLSLLKKEGLVSVRKEGKWSYYSLNLKSKSDIEKNIVDAVIKIVSSELEKSGFEYAVEGVKC
jgi:ArsR family transcriptional regulator